MTGNTIPSACPVHGKTPFVWLGHDLKSPFHVWNHIQECQGICLSAAQVLTKPGYNQLFRNRGLREVLEFKGPIFLDSGGFRFQRLGQSEFDFTHVLELYRALNPDVGAILDFPLDPTQSDEVNNRRWRRTLANTRRMLAGGDPARIVPVIHAYNAKSARARLGQLLEFFPKPSMICVGSLVPLLKASYISSRFAPRENEGGHVHRWGAIADIILTIKSLAPHIPLHVFGAGSLSTISLLLALGVDSVDSTGWRMKAAFGAIQLPGLGDRFPLPATDSLRTRRGLSPACKKLLAECECPSCSGSALASRIRHLSASFNERAVHNAHVLLSEVRGIASAIRRGQGREFVARRLESSPGYRKVLVEAILPRLEAVALRKSQTREDSP